MTSRGTAPAKWLGMHDGAYTITVSVDGDNKVTRHYVGASQAEKFYERQIALYGLGARKPKERGMIRLNKHGSTVRSAEWRPAFGWY